MVGIPSNSVPTFLMPHAKRHIRERDDWPERVRRMAERKRRTKADADLNRWFWEGEIA